MVKSARSLPKYSEEQIEDLLEMQRDIIREKVESFEEKIGYFPFFSLALAFALGLGLGIALSPRSRK